jgi:gamma-glutamyl:cysteine ligase YbdK (ATP-grasp superfamily)
VNSEPPESTIQPGMAERAIDTATDVSRTVTELSAALRAAVDRLSQRHRDSTATRKAAFDHQRHYPGSSAHKLVCRLLVRGRNSAPALEP